jgi:ABC-2 type transport system permease protein
MLKYLRLLGLYAKTSLMIDMEYRANFIGALFMTVFEVIWSAISTLVFFSFTDSIGGWTYNEALIVVGLLFVSFGFLDTVIWANVEQLAIHVLKGTLDFVLTKPVNSQFHTTLQRIRLDRIASMLGGVFLIGYALLQLRAAPALGQWLMFVFMVIGALVLLYSLLIIFGTLAFWSHEVRGFTELIFALIEIGRFPVAALPEPVRAIMTFVIPIAFITTVPAEVLLGKLTTGSVFYGWIFALLAFAFCAWFWRFAVKRYASAA